MKKNYLLTLLLGLTAASLTAAPRDLTNARTLASQQLGSAHSSADEMELLFAAPVADDAEAPAYYLFAPKSGTGFVAVAGDDRMPSAIIGYSDNAPTDPARIPPALEAYLSDYAKLVDAVRQGRELRDADYAAIAGSAEKATIGPLVSCKWGQESPYNYLTPNKYYSGCVATAMSQVMYYYKFPAHGYGSGAPASPTTGTLDFTTSTYDWANMRDTYTTMTSAQRIAVATLMRDAGYAVRMQYASTGSGAYSFDIPEAMVCNFNYDPKTIINYMRDTWSTSGWSALIRSELEAGRPIIYSAQSPNGGHCFVCDGIDGRDFLHINWGWDGDYDGFFDMSILNAYNYDIVIDKADAFYQSQDIVCGIRPGDANADQTGWHSPITLDAFYANNTIDAESGIIKSLESTKLTISSYYGITNTTRRDLSSSNCVVYLVCLNADGTVRSKTRDWTPTNKSGYSSNRSKAYIRQDTDASGTFSYIYRYIDPSSAEPDSLREFIHGDLINPMPINYTNAVMTALNTATFSAPSSKLELVEASLSEVPEPGVALSSNAKLSLVIRNNSWATNSFSGIKAGFRKLNDDLTPTSSYTYLAATIGYEIYPGAEVTFNVPAKGTTLAEGYYQLVASSTTMSNPVIIHVTNASGIASAKTDGARLVYDAQSRTLALRGADRAVEATVVTPTGAVAARLTLEPDAPQRLNLSAGAYVITSTVGSLKVIY